MEHLKAFVNSTKSYAISYVSCDQNYDILKMDQHRPTQSYFSYMFDNSYVPHILKPTRITHNSSTLIDNIFVRMKSFDRNNSFVIVDGMSDHYPCLLTYALKPVSSCLSSKFEKRKITESALLKIQQSLLFHDWGLIDCMDVNESYKYLINTVTKMLDLYAPKKIVMIRHDESYSQG